MAGDWIKFEIGTSDKPEVWSIAQQLNIDPDAVVGKLLRVWGWFDQHTENGNAAIVTKMLLDRVVGVTGFCNAVISCGWMGEGDGFIWLPNFDRHNGKTAKTRAVTAKRVASFKEGKRRGNDSGNGEVTPEPLPKEEKRREDKNITTADAVVCAEQSCSPPPQGDQPKKSAPAKPAEPAVLELLTTRADVLVPVTQTQIDQWADAYPAVDVMQALRRIQSWLSCNPKKRKTPAGMFRFVDSWLAREQDKPRVDPGGPPPGQPLGPQPGRQFLNSREKNAQRNAEIFDYQTATNF